MKVSQFILYTGFGFLLLSCANKLTPTQKGSLYGYTNTKGEWKIDRKYVEAYPFNEGLARVGFNIEKIDSFWNEPMFDYEGYWNVDTYKVVRYSFIDKNDSIFPLRLNEAKNYKGGLVAARQKQWWGYLNKNGEWQIEPKYAVAGNFEKGVADVIRENNAADRWYYLTIDKNGEIVKDDKEGKTKPDWFDSIPDWQTLLASGNIYVRLTDYESALNYYKAATRRIDEIEQKDTLAYLDLCQEVAYLSAMKIDDATFETYDNLATEKIEEVLKAAKTERRRMILLKYIDYLFKLSELRDLNMQKDLEIETLERILDVVERSQTEDISLYWDIEEKLKKLKE